MNRTELLALHDDLNAQGVAIMKAKNHDYAGASPASPFANFTACESASIATTEQGFLVRMMDKFMRLINFAKSGTLKIKDESRRDTVIDFRNYLVLFEAYCSSKAPQSGGAPPLSYTDDPADPVYAPIPPDFALWESKIKFSTFVKEDLGAAMLTTDPFIATLSGKNFYLLLPDPDLVDMGDIAHALSRTCRWTGHTIRHYSIAEHSLNCLTEAVRLSPTDYEFHLHALLHDAAEAYIGDLSRPFKSIFQPKISEIEQRVILAIYTHLDLRSPDSHQHTLIKNIDNSVLLAEADRLFPHSNWKSWGIDAVPAKCHISLCEPGNKNIETIFLNKLKELTEKLTRSPASTPPDTEKAPAPPRYEYFVARPYSGGALTLYKAILSARGADRPLYWALDSEWGVSAHPLDYLRARSKPFSYMQLVNWVSKADPGALEEVKGSIYE